jgi:hypothetical protein
LPCLVVASLQTPFRFAAPGDGERRQNALHADPLDYFLISGLLRDPIYPNLLDDPANANLLQDTLENQSFNGLASSQPANFFLFS